MTASVVRAVSKAEMKNTMPVVNLNKIWLIAQGQWPEIDRDKTYLIFTERSRVESLVVKAELPDEKTMLAGGHLRAAQMLGDDMGLSLEERLELMCQSSCLETESILLKPVGGFVMGYSPRANLLAVQTIPT